MTDLVELRERVWAATGPDWKIDMDIDWLFSEWKNLGGGWVKHKTTGEEKRSSYPASPTVTASIDAALALTERVLPGWKWNVGMDALDEVHATIWQGVTEADQYAATPPLAILAALLTALIATEAGRTAIQGETK